MNKLTLTATAALVATVSAANTYIVSFPTASLDKFKACTENEEAPAPTNLIAPGDNLTADPVNYVIGDKTFHSFESYQTTFAATACAGVVVDTVKATQVDAKCANKGGHADCAHLKGDVCTTTANVCAEGRCLVQDSTKSTCADKANLVKVVSKFKGTEEEKKTFDTALGKFIVGVKDNKCVGVKAVENVAYYSSDCKMDDIYTAFKKDASAKDLAGEYTFTSTAVTPEAKCFEDKAACGKDCFVCPVKTTCADNADCASNKCEKVEEEEKPKPTADVKACVNSASYASMAAAAAVAFAALMF